MKKKIKVICLWIFIPIMIAILGYLALACYYMDGFSYGTWVNDIYCTGKSIEEINEELKSQYIAKDLQISYRDGTSETLHLDNIAMEVDFKEPLVELKKSQKPLKWGENLFLKSSRFLVPKRTFDLDSVKEEMKTLSFHSKKVVSPLLEIVLTDNGYQLIDETNNIIDVEKAKAKILEALSEGEATLSLEEAGCYTRINLTNKDLAIYEEWDRINEFQDFHMRYLFGEDIEIVDESVMCNFIKLDKEGNILLDDENNLILDEEKVKEYIVSLASKYDTLNGTRQFKATRGETVTIQGGTYGNKLNQKAELTYLLEAIRTKNEIDRIPEFTHMAKKQGIEDIGNTYIEIDMTTQKLYYYVKGQLELESDIVTGNMMKKHETPARVCFVYGKQKNRILRGPGYASFVNFWMPVNGNIGIHDASWRKDFGGDIYKKSGSHGCINMPFDNMKILYEEVEIGTPVAMFY